MLNMPQFDSPHTRALRSLPKRLREQIEYCRGNPKSILFLDIETTGLSHYYDAITLVGWSFGGSANTLVAGQDPGRLLTDLANAKVLVTFNGIRFDQRFLHRDFPSIIFPESHIDLMYLCRRFGLKGGQKSIEKQLGIDLRIGIEDVDGYSAVLLWHQYVRGDIEALKRLVTYNRADIAAMGAIFDHVLRQASFEPDLFAPTTEFLHWSAPLGWRDLPQLGAAKPAVAEAPHFDGLLSAFPAARARVVGIDLTGSEQRGSGWCLLSGNHASTETVFTNADLLARTVAATPDLVSIDSPLCLPYGRTSVGDDDPGRLEFGIMRQCERELKRRGVNVYPCLLPSMQKLTARGILLADALRKQGIPVIESYPGAAQDIMRIPRKGAGVEWLKKGLEEFGIVGPYTTQNVTHDELDAITSALVGTFHLAGLSEALGTEHESPLIIPKLDAKSGVMVVGLSGPIAAGKTTTAQEFEKRGFAYTRFSLVIDELLRESGTEPNRADRQALGQQINASGRQRWLAERTLLRVQGSPAIVVDGLRFPEDHAYLVETYGDRFLHIFIETPVDVRRNRYTTRWPDGAFDEVSVSEVESRVGDLRALAHRIIGNASDKSELDTSIAALVVELRGRVTCRSRS